MAKPRLTSDSDTAKRTKRLTFFFFSIGAGEVQDVRAGREYRELPRPERVLAVQWTRAGRSQRPRASGVRGRPAVRGRTEHGRGHGGRRPFARHTQRRRAGDDKFQDVAARGDRARQALQPDRGDVPGAGHGQLLRRPQ